MAEPSKRGRRAFVAVAAVAALVVAGLVAHGAGLVHLPGAARVPGSAVTTTTASPLAAAMPGLSVADRPTPPPTAALLDPEGRTVDISAFRGKVAVVNLWAMWCAPCREEMPTLAALQRAYDPAQVVVVAVNVDGDPAAETGARAFLADHAPLAFYREPTFRLPFLLPGAGAMPQTVLLDRQGRIRAWKTGAADWSGPQARAAVDALLTEPA